MKFLPGFFLFALSQLPLVLNAQSKRALIIAIGDYPEANGWNKISSLNDVPYILRVLERHQFEKKEVLSNQHATAHGINEAFKKLINESRRGDKVYIHVSSHGCQVADNNGDEADGFDECIVGFNAVPQERSTNFEKDQAEYFRDDQFGFYITELQRKLGREGDIVVFIDACHSGTGTRGQAIVRGGKLPLAPPHFSSSTFGTAGKEDLMSESSSTDPESDVASYVVISAARAEELDYETKDENNTTVGPLTYAVSQVFDKIEPRTTYRSIFSRIQIAMDQKISNSLQHPVLEGTGLDREIFGGSFSPHSPSIEIERIKGREIMVNSGKLAGLELDAKVALFKAEAISASDSSLLISYGKVTRSGMFEAVIEVFNPPIITRPVEGKVFLIEPIYKIEPVRINFFIPKTRGTSSSFSVGQMAAISSSLKKLPIVSIQKDPDLYLVKGKGMDSIKIASNGYIFQTVPDMSLKVDEMTDVIRQYSQYKFLKSVNINQHDPKFSIDVKLVPVINGKADTSRIESKKRNGVYQFTDDDTLTFLITNNSVHPLYINILDLQPDGIINKILPNREQKIYPSDLRFEPGVSRLLDNYFVKIYPPYGNEILKIFVSDRELDMESLATTRGGSAKGNLGFLEALFKDSFRVAEKRGGEGISLAGSNGSTYDLLFEIKKKK